eukprot:CAMPEP_0185749366 /NCGR_PEP_ID=MMETSP1174-20130828/8074_1 /TAXON_ID=35687 /ORGANISM="Dictyocha speculum, Strain CCMP1381" /LENGTH=187 /DNA_ID=CAMNT_0028425443 /DNA_START=1 /DNA_END=564 /DNA_ORIENTATION=-
MKFRRCLFFLLPLIQAFQFSVPALRKYPTRTKFSPAHREIDEAPRTCCSGEGSHSKSLSLGFASQLGVLLFASSSAFAAVPSDPDTVISVMGPRGVTVQDSVVFVIGVVPFAWATWEFWRRIAVGAPFGTGKDSVIIGEDANPESSRGRRVLGKDAFLAAYVLFAIAGASLLLTLFLGVQAGVETGN